MNRDRIISELQLRPFGQKGWLYNINSVCWNPSCRKTGKLGILMESKNIKVVHCFYCGEATSLKKYLISIGRVDLVSEEVDISVNESLEGIEKKERVIEEALEIKPPIGFKKIDRDGYLTKRKFLPYHYKVFQPGKSTLEPKLDSDYIIFQIFQDKKLVGWLARSKKPKKWHKENIEKSKLGVEDLQLRYVNSSTNFDRILGGYDEITDKTDTVIVVEGLFDKVSVDKELRLYKTDEVKCLFTFGDKITEAQIALIKKKKSVKNIFLFYDYNTIYQTKKSAMMIASLFPNTYICEIKRDTDPGEMYRDEILECIGNAKTPTWFYLNRV